jgi:hypothetical protein
MRTFLTHNLALLLLAAALALTAVFHPFKNWPLIRWDGEGYHLWTYAILRGDLNFAPYSETHATIAVVPADPQRGFYANKYPPGVALIRLPVMAFFTDPNAPGAVPTLAENYAVLILSSLALLATAYFMLRSARLAGAPEWAAQVATLAVIFGTGPFHYATFYGSYSHVWSGLGLAIFMFLGLRALNTPGGKLPVVSTVATVVLLVLVRNTNALAIAALALAYAADLLRRGVSRREVLRDLLIVAVAGAVGLTVQIALNSYAFGRLTLSAYAGEPFLWGRPMAWSVLTAYDQGLLLYAPLVGVVLVAGLAVRATRPATVGYGLLLLAYAFLYGFWHSWMLGAGFGHRGFVELMPPAVPLLAVALGQLPRSGRIAALLAVALSVFMSLELMAGYWRGSFPWHSPTREDYVAHLWGEQSFFARGPFD